MKHPIERSPEAPLIHAVNDIRKELEVPANPFLQEARLFSYHFKRDRTDPECSPTSSAASPQMYARFAAGCFPCYEVAGENTMLCIEPNTTFVTFDEADLQGNGQLGKKLFSGIVKLSRWDAIPNQCQVYKNAAAAVALSGQINQYISHIDIDSCQNAKT